MTEHVLTLDDPECHRSAVAGGKGAGLCAMRAAGMPVPPGFVITSGAMRDSLTEQGVLDHVAALAASFDGGPDGTGIAEEIHELVTGAGLSDALAEQVTTAYLDLGRDVSVAVRSSACAEDGKAASFAGQQETFLNITGPAAVLGRVVDCWASFFSERALFYRHRKGSVGDLGMAVVVQRQIAAETSGVVFTIDPVRRRADQMVIEAAFGLGEAVVSGMVTPDNYVVRRDGRLKKATVGRHERMVVRDVRGGTRVVELDDTRAASPVLDAEDIARLVAMGILLEATFGEPQDIEWAFEAGELYVLQSRPITA